MAAKPLRERPGGIGEEPPPTHAHASGAGRTYVPICVSSLLANRPPLLDLYEFAQGQFVLYCKAAAEFTTDVRDRLLASGVTSLYALMPRDGTASEQSIGAILRMPDDQVPPLLKAGLLYRSGIAAAEMVFATHAEPASVAAASKAVGLVVASLAREASCPRAMLRLLDHDDSVFSHSVNTCVYATILGNRLGLAGPDLHRIGLAAFLHDVGKANVPSQLLSKPAALSADEWRIMRRHPIWSAELLAEANLDATILNGIIRHHERLDGSGYPSGLRGAEIDPVARAIAVVDAYDALTTHRPYRPAYSPYEALLEIRAEAGERFDRDAFTSLVQALGGDLRADGSGFVG